MALVLTSCFGGKETTANGGELTGASGKGFSEPAPYGMVLIKRGHLRMGLEAQDTLWGRHLGGGLLDGRYGDYEL